MKNIFLPLFCLFTFIGFSQMTMKKLDGTPINDGDIIGFNVATDPEAYFGFKIYNSSNADMNVKVKCVSITNSTGTDLQFCINPVCVSSLVVGNSYPGNSPSVIPANGENGNFDHLINTNTGIISNANVEYTLKFYQVDDSNVEIGNSVTFTYRYNANLGVASVNQLEEMGVQLKSNTLFDNLDIEISSPMQIKMYDLNGRLVGSNQLVSGSNTINVSNLSSSIYFLKFQNKEGKTATAKVIKQ